MTNNPSQQKTAKLKFFAVYIVSVALIIIILAAFRKTEQLPPAAAENEAGTTDNQLSQADALLHSRMSELDKLRLSAIQNPLNAERSEFAIQNAETAFILLLDSLEKQMGGLADEQQETWSSLLASFKNELQVKNLLHDSYGQVFKKQQTAQPVNTNSAETERMKSSLEEKDKTINLLQQQLARKPASVPQTIVEDKETKKKLANLQAAFDRLQEQSKNMERSYKVVVEDNRRLLTQLQSSRKQ